ncbi:MAG: TetR family transcriptional regulator [Candidatus Obscuribacterales bacterium]|nr:TetR family transcriptional regulator [Steroidobacteraceae bacterium]
MADLDADSIAAAALSVADKHGVDGFTMRAVADALGVTPMALYHHVQNKAALVTLIVDTVIRKHPLPPTTGVWQDDLLAVAQWMRQGMLKHPVVAQLRRAYNVWTPAMLQMTERWLGLWQHSALDLEDAVLAATTSSMVITGLVKEEMIFRTMKHPDEKTLAWLPNVRIMCKAQPDRDAQFDLVMRSLIEGMHARLMLKRSASARTHSLSSALNMSVNSAAKLAANASHRGSSRKPSKRSKG